MKENSLTFVRTKSSNDSHRNPNNRLPMSIPSAQRFLSENNLVLTKADKGESVEICDRQQYLNKCKEFIDTKNIVILKKDPTNLHETSVEKGGERIILNS